MPFWELRLVRHPVILKHNFCGHLKVKYFHKFSYYLVVSKHDFNKLLLYPLPVSGFQTHTVTLACPGMGRCRHPTELVIAGFLRYTAKSVLKGHLKMAIKRRKYSTSCASRKKIEIWSAHLQDYSFGPTCCTNSLQRGAG